MIEPHRLINKLENRIQSVLSYCVSKLTNINDNAFLEYRNNLDVGLPTIVLSSGCEIFEALRAMQAEAIDFMGKPFIENTLIQKVLNVLGLAQ